MLSISFCPVLSIITSANPARPSIYIDPQNVRADINAVFSINVSISEITNLFSYELRLKYDSTILNCTHAEIRPGTFLASNDNVTVQNGEIHQDEGYVGFVYGLRAPEEPRNGSGVLGTITFQVSKKGECSLEIYDNMLMGYVDVISPGEYDVDHGYIAAPIDRYGDLNGDGVVNIADLVVVGRAYPSRPGDPDWNPIADVNSDDRINIIDAVLVAKEFRTKV